MNDTVIEEKTDLSLYEQALLASKQTPECETKQLLGTFVDKALEGSLSFDKSLVKTLTAAIEQIDSHKCDLSAVIQGILGVARSRSREPALGPRPPLSHACLDDPRSRARGQRTAGRSTWRAVGKTVSTVRCVGGSDLWQKEIRPRQG